MQPSETAHPSRSYGLPAAAPLPSFAPIPPVSAPAHPGPSRPPSSNPPAPPGPSASSQRFHPRDDPGPSTAQQPWNSEPIPPIDELRSGVPLGPSRFNAPNLTTYVEHYHYYHFAGNCTVYQAADPSRSRPVQIVSERPQGPEGPGGPRMGGFPAQSARHHPPSPYSREGSHRARYGEPPVHQMGMFPGGATQSLPVIMPLQQVPVDYSGAHGPQREGVSTAGSEAPLPALATEPPVGPTYERPMKRSRALSLPNAGLLRRVGTTAGSGSRSTTALATPIQSPNRSPTKKKAAAAGAAAAAAAVAAISTAQPPVPSSMGTTSTGPAPTASSAPAVASSSKGRPPARGKGIGGKGPVAVGRQASAGEGLMNDWEHIVKMYMTGEGTPDGRALREITRGDGRRVEDRKLLEKRRTIGKTFERLGRPLFEAAIGYKMEGKYRRKQKMYHVIARCRVVNGFRKSGEELPTDAVQLTAIIDQKMHAKAQRGLIAAEAAAAAAAAQLAAEHPSIGAGVPHSPSSQDRKSNALIAAAAHHQAQHAHAQAQAQVQAHSYSAVQKDQKPSGYIAPTMHLPPHQAHVHSMSHEHHTMGPLPRPPLGPVDFSAPLGPGQEHFRRGEPAFVVGDKQAFMGDKPAALLAAVASEQAEAEAQELGSRRRSPQKRRHA